MDRKEAVLKALKGALQMVKGQMNGLLNRPSDAADNPIKYNEDDLKYGYLQTLETALEFYIEGLGGGMDPEAPFQDKELAALVKKYDFLSSSQLRKTIDVKAILNKRMAAKKKKPGPAHGNMHGATFWGLKGAAGIMGGGGAAGGATGAGGTAAGLSSLQGMLIGLVGGTTIAGGSFILSMAMGRAKDAQRQQGQARPTSETSAYFEYLVNWARTAVQTLKTGNGTFLPDPPLPFIEWQNRQGPMTGT
jgi:hypothetical protein